MDIAIQERTRCDAKMGKMSIVSDYNSDTSPEHPSSSQHVSVEDVPILREGTGPSRRIEHLRGLHKIRSVLVWN